MITFRANQELEEKLNRQKELAEERGEKFNQSEFIRQALLEKLSAEG